MGSHPFRDPIPDDLFGLDLPQQRELDEGIGFRNSINRSRLGKLTKRRDFVRGTGEEDGGVRERMGPVTN